MEVSLHSEYSFRILIYLALQPEGLSQIKTIAEYYNISVYHLNKVVQNLVKFGYVDSYRGRDGGIKLAMEPGRINLGQVFRCTESNLGLLNCFDSTAKECRIVGICGLHSILSTALQSFLSELDQVTLQDITSKQKSFYKAT